jgi:hypothetical protein
MAKEVAKVQADNSCGVTSAIMGILSVTLPLLSPVILPSIVFAIIGIVFASKQNKISKNKWSKRGKILSIIGIIIVILGVALNYWIATNHPELLAQLGNLQK